MNQECVVIIGGETEAERRAIFKWAQEQGDDVIWGLEGARRYSRVTVFGQPEAEQVGILESLGRWPEVVFLPMPGEAGDPAPAPAPVPAPAPAVSPEPFFHWPTDNERRTINHPFGQPRSYGPHEGVDIYAQAGDKILAARAGAVIHASDRVRGDPGRLSKYGWHVVLDHGDGWFTWYAHMDSLLVGKGDTVEHGQAIGMAGSTGNSTGVHLHFNAVHRGQGKMGYVVADVVDPAPLLM